MNTDMLEDITGRDTLIREFQKFKIPLRFIDYDENFTKPRRKGAYVINLGNVYDSGTHWTCLWYDGSNEYYFDSYGFPPPQRVVNKIGDYFFNDTVIQDVMDGRCGLYAFMFCLYMHYGEGSSQQRYKSFLNNFSKVAKRNFDVIGRMYESLFM